MSSSFASLPAIPQALCPEPSKHVNYTLGMLLGVDDFKQEFAYLAGRDQWLARDLLGYGVLNGLRVSVDTHQKGPRVKVASGAALSPGGQLICVKPAQCAYLNDWLAANLDEVTRLMSSPPGSSLKLYVVLCYRSCPVDPVPIPGEPCRSEDELRQPSRIVDDFQLELRTTAPPQVEEEGVHEFVEWLNQVQFTDEPGTFINLEDFEAALRAAIPEASSVAEHGLVLPFGSPLAGLRIHPANAREYLRTALRIWVSEIRPLVHPPCVPSGGCCNDAKGHNAPPLEDCLKLAELSVPVFNVGPGQKWRVDDQNPVQVDESQRPFLAHLRMLQELIQFQAGAAETYVELPPGSQPVSVVAAGIVGPTTSRAPILGGLAVTAPADGELHIAFPTYHQPDNTFQYIVKVVPVHDGNVPAVGLDSFEAIDIVMRVNRGATPVPSGSLAAMEFMIEITRIG